MQAIFYRKYGSPDVLELLEVPDPQPKDDELLIKIHASTVTMGDCEMRAFRMPPLIWLPTRIMFGVFGPKHKILGQELSGVVTALGKDVTSFKVGDEVVAPTDMKLGAHAEYICLPEQHAIAKKPTSMSFAEAATIPTGGLNALYFLTKAEIRKGEHVLIVGAGGSIGTYAVQLAKYYGAYVTAVDSTFKLDMLRELGVDRVIDYTKTDFTTLPDAYDVIFDIVCKEKLSKCIKTLKPNGRYLAANLELSRIIAAMRKSLKDGKRVITGVANYTKEDMEYLTGLAEQGVLKSVIDRRYPLALVADAHRYVDKDLKAGNVVIEIIK